MRYGRQQSAVHAAVHNAASSFLQPDLCLGANQAVGCRCVIDCWCVASGATFLHCQVPPPPRFSTCTACLRCSPRLRTYARVTRRVICHCPLTHCYLICCFPCCCALADDREPLEHKPALTIKGQPCTLQLRACLRSGGWLAIRAHECLYMFTRPTRGVEEQGRLSQGGKRLEIAHVVPRSCLLVCCSKARSAAAAAAGHKVSARCAHAMPHMY